MAILYAGMFADSPSWTGTYPANNVTVAPYITYWGNMVRSLTRADGEIFSFSIHPTVTTKQDVNDRAVWEFGRGSGTDTQAFLEMTMNFAARSGQNIMGARINRTVKTTGTVSLAVCQMGGNVFSLLNSAEAQAYVEIVVDWETLKLDVYANGVLTSSRDIVTTSGQGFAIAIGSYNTNWSGVTPILSASSDKFKLSDFYYIKNSVGAAIKTPRLGPVIMKSSFPTDVDDTGGSSSSGEDILAVSRANVVSTGVYNPDTFAPIGAKPMILSYAAETPPAGAELKAVALSCAAVRGDPTVPGNLVLSFREEKVGTSYPVLGSASYPVSSAKSLVGQYIFSPEEYDPLKPVIVGIDIER